MFEEVSKNRRFVNVRVSNKRIILPQSTETIIYSKGCGRKYSGQNNSP
tara:strand:- start:1705 stop:1848 length:144 start_codon:yes stop_codon:yes gene_type:complete